MLSSLALLALALPTACGPSAEQCASDARALLAADPKNPAAAAPLACACDGGVAGACTALGTWLREGVAGEADPVASLGRMRRACALGDGQGCNAAGAALEHGLGAERDRAAAHEAYLQGCRAAQPSPAACSNAGAHLFSGALGRRDPEGAATLFERGCRLGDRVCCDQLQGTRDPASLRQRFGQGCALGDPAACTGLATLLPNGDPERKRLLDGACAAGSASACDLPP